MPAPPLGKTPLNISALVDAVEDGVKGAVVECAVLHVQIGLLEKVQHRVCRVIRQPDEAAFSAGIVSAAARAGGWRGEAVAYCNRAAERGAGHVTGQCTAQHLSLGLVAGYVEE